MPKGLPDDSWFGIVLRHDNKNDAPLFDIPFWQYQTFETVAGDREAEMEYLLPFNGVVRHQLPELPLEYIRNIRISIELITPPGAIYREYKLAAQSSWLVFIFPDELEKSNISKYTRDRDARQIGSREEVGFDATRMIEVK